MSHSWCSKREWLLCDNNIITASLASLCIVPLDIMLCSQEEVWSSVPSHVQSFVLCNTLGIFGGLESILCVRCLYPEERVLFGMVVNLGRRMDMHMYEYF